MGVSARANGLLLSKISGPPVVLGRVVIALTLSLGGGGGGGGGGDTI